MTTSITARDLKVVGRYELLQKLSAGSMGNVYRGRDRETGATVAVKVLTTQVSANAKLTQRFAREARSAAKLDHPNIVRVLEFGQEKERAYFAMEFVEGTSLGQKIESDGPLAEDAAVGIVTQVAQALHYAHHRRVIHRDVKPDNVLLRPDGHVKLADFGLAKDFDDDRDLTRAASGLGTPHFMAPEQYEDAKNATALSDVYSLGATLYAAVTGQVPFASCTSLVAIAKMAKGEIPAPRALVPTLSDHADQAIRRAMSPDPSRRPLTCLHFIQLLVGGRNANRKGTGNRRNRDAVPAASDGPEKRVAERHRFRVGTTCVINTGASGGDAPEDWPTRVVDVSESGVGLILARRFEKGARFAVELEGDAHHAAVTLRVKVVRLRREPMGHWFHGCTFTVPLSEDDLHSLLG